MARSDGSTFHQASAVLQVNGVGAGPTTARLAYSRYLIIAALLAAVLPMAPRALASPERCLVVWRSPDAGRVEVQSDEGLENMFPGSGFGAPMVRWLPPRRGDPIELVLGYTPGEVNSIPPPGAVGNFGPLQGGHLQVQWPETLPNRDMTVTVKDDHAHVWSYGGAQLNRGPSGKGRFDVDFKDETAEERAVLRAIGTSRSLTVEVRAQGRLVKSAHYDLSAIDKRDRLIVVGLQKVRAHDGRTCTTSPPKGPPVRMY